MCIEPDEDVSGTPFQRLRGATLLRSEALAECALSAEDGVPILWVYDAF